MGLNYTRKKPLAKDVRPASDFYLKDLGDGRAILIDLKSGAAWVSVTELAGWCESDRTAISHLASVTRSLPEKLKASLGKGSLSMTRVENIASTEPWSCISVDDAYEVLDYYAHEARGHEFRTSAKALQRRMGKAGATVYAYGLAGYSVRPIAPSRVLPKPQSWEALFQKETTDRAVMIFGTWNSETFWWKHVYNFLTPDERAQLDRDNPIIPGKYRRATKIHQWLAMGTRDAVREHMVKVHNVLMTANCRSDFEAGMQRLDGLSQGALPVFD